ncbi:MAG TPA: hypothetical protein VK960_11080 [Acidimicrobiia bacterium]|nr:hypothetical protein [Acidimicrobiia bacterium]
MISSETLDLAAGHAIGCTTTAESAIVEDLSEGDPEFAAALQHHRSTVAGLDALMSQPAPPRVWERIAQSLD